jgi:hypothetical protein
MLMFELPIFGNIRRIGTWSLHGLESSKEDDHCVRFGVFTAVTITRRNIPEDTILHSHRRENLKSYTGWSLCKILGFHGGDYHTA